MDVFVTRFTDVTWMENQKYCNKKNIDTDNKIIYNSPVMISSNVPYNSEILVFELNNSTNKIMGMSVVRNRIRGTRQHNMYSNQNYNRYSYCGRNRISVEQMTSVERQVMAFLETIWFTGKGHIKRGRGMSKALTSGTLFTRCREILDVPMFMKRMFEIRSRSRDATHTHDNNQVKRVKLNILNRPLSQPVIPPNATVPTYMSVIIDQPQN
jgi:hypothetical protein